MPKRNVTVLLVDDDRMVIKLVKRYLEDAGFAVLTAADGEEGLTVFLRHQSSISIVVSDVTMPRMDGCALADQVLNMVPTLPVIFMSGNAFNADRGYGCVAKRFTAAVLIARVEEVLVSTGTAGV